jgi:hypothetical protein
MLLPDGYGFRQSQAEKDAWEVKEFQDALTAQRGGNVDATAKETQEELGGFRQHSRAILLAFAAYMG